MHAPLTPPPPPPRRRRLRRAMVALALVALALAVVVRFGNDAFIALEGDAPSRSAGTPSAGSLANGRRLPTRGENFTAYSRLGALLGRNTVHALVRDTVLDAYARVARELPGRVFVYGETGWPRGGRFRPHRTHQNGTSVDFMVPVLDARGASVPLPTPAHRRFGYAWEFDEAGRAGDLRIDFDAMAAHLRALDRAGRARGVRVARVIFDPALHAPLFGARGGAELRGAVPFMARRAWVRHDEHYHVDFALP